jgi:hypothetical protein
MLCRLKIMQSFDGQILNLPTICGIRIVININNLAENGEVPGDGRVRPVAARAALGLKACAPPGSDPDRERRENRPALSEHRRLAPAGEGAAAVQPSSIHERRIRPDCRCNAAANVGYVETGRRSALSGYPISPRGLSLEA